jgi:hypothetical protein
LGIKSISSLALLFASALVNAAAVLPAPENFAEENPAALRTALPIYVELSSENHGQWSGDRLRWRLDIQSPDAKALHIGFSKLELPDGASLRLQSAAGTDKTWTALELKQVSWLPAAIGDQVTLSLSRQASSDPVDIRISQVNYGYKKSSNLQKAGSCEVSTSCEEGDGWRDELQSGMRIDFFDSANGATLSCTGVLLNNTAADGAPLILTANHCIADASEAQSVTVYWNYQLSSCGSPERPADTSLDGVQMGATLVATWEDSDFSLIRLNQKPNDVDPRNDVHYGGWDNRNLTPNSAVTIHHPNADSKRISYEYEQLRITELGATRATFDANFLRIEGWDIGSTELGSSGGGLWDAKRCVVGQLFGGAAACGNQESDWFGRLATSWNGGGTPSSRLSDWLDPRRIGAKCLNGGDPADLAPRFIETDCSTSSGGKRNVEGATSGIEFEPYSGGGGGAPWGIFLVLLSLLGLANRRRG